MPSEAIRPDGVLIWAHATSIEDARMLSKLVSRLAMQRADVDISLLLTTPAGVDCNRLLKSYVHWAQMPADNALAAERFLVKWTPDICLWAGGHFRPSLIREAHSRDIPMILVSVHSEGLQGGGLRRMLMRPNKLLMLFDAVTARTHTDAALLMRIGMSQDDLLAVGEPQMGDGALSYSVSDREELGESLAGRPIWLAARVQVDELDIILASHRRATRVAHRLLLVIVPEHETDGDQFYSHIQDNGWRCVRWSDGEFPSDTTQILLADTTGELGLWYRMAPFCFMGSSLTHNHKGRTPFEAATLGSAILYGPYVSDYLDGYRRLSHAGAARIVRDIDTLAAAITQLSAPDHVASMANAGWQAASDGAEVTDAILDRIVMRLEQKAIM